MQLQRVERVLHHQHDAFRYVAVARQRLVDPVPDIAHLERATLHAAEAHLTGEAAVEQEQAEAVRRIEVALAVPRAAAGAKRLLVERGVDAARIGARLPPFEPLPAAEPYFAPLVPVVGAQRSQHDATTNELGHNLAPSLHDPLLRRVRTGLPRSRNRLEGRG